MEERYDVAIIGTGPAGLEAAINCKIRNKSVIIFGSNELSTKLSKAPKIDNYLGFHGISGKDLKKMFLSHIHSMDISITEERINAVYAMGDYYALMVNEKIYEAKTLILATGIEYTKPYKGEEEFLGRGVGYCATCDAPLYKGKDVVIIAQSESAEEEANYVKEICNKLYYIPLYNGNYDLNKDIEIIKGNPQEIRNQGDKREVVLSKETLVADGVFILRETISPKQLVAGLEVEEGHIKVNRDMATNLKGCFAAGDCIGKPYQYIKAAGEGLVAALSAVSYIDNIGKNK
ncbi:NAD(P)/FAD-dependent oxidoreductase [Clostridium sp.]|uniref:NAD(P)/FAD-dependent oxidoreductase n=1 Tax=Clostridium sp. TaxID=1506 RepID=UPI002FCBFB00